MTIVEKLQSLCDDRNLTLAGLERETGLSRGSVRLWDKNAPSVDKVAKVARYFDLSVDYLCGIERKEELKAHTLAEKNFLLLAKKAANLPDHEREMLLNYFNHTVELYLNATDSVKEKY